jgi:hypothetical protein
MAWGATDRHAQPLLAREAGAVNARVPLREALRRDRRALAVDPAVVGVALGADVAVKLADQLDELRSEDPCARGEVSGGGRCQQQRNARLGGGAAGVRARPAAHRRGSQSSGRL